ncbi:hypothetical protein C0993_006824, partial [Termitomyces sp. T159_Od127]
RTRRCREVRGGLSLPVRRDRVPRSEEPARRRRGAKTEQVQRRDTRPQQPRTAHHVRRPNPEGARGDETRLYPPLRALSARADMAYHGTL